jgi:hypothetical protein
MLTPAAHCTRRQSGRSGCHTGEDKGKNISARPDPGARLQRRSCRDMRPAAHLLFFTTKKSRQKKVAPTVAAPLRVATLRCSGPEGSRRTRPFARCAANGAQTASLSAAARRNPPALALLDATHGEHAPARLRHRARSRQYGLARPAPFKSSWSCRTDLPGSCQVRL